MNNASLTGKKSTLRKSIFITVLGLFLTILAVPPAFALQTLKLGIHPFLSSSEIIRRFKPLADYLGRELGMPVTIEIADSYRTHIRNVGTGAVDMAFMGPASYVILTGEYGPRPILAAFETNGKRTFRGVIVTRQENPITSLSQLKGKRFAFGDRDSTMSYFVPRHMLLKAGVDVKALAERQFLTNHDNIAIGVLAGDFDAGALKEDVFRLYEREGLKAIAFSQEFGDHLFLMGAKSSAPMTQAVRQALLGLKDRPEGKAILGAIQKDLSALVPATDSEYANLRAVLKELKTVGVEP